MSKDGPLSDHLIWVDLEMTGLDPDRDVILEIATLITDNELNIVARGPELVVHQTEERLQAMDDWNREHHSKSGLWQKAVASEVTAAAAAAQTLAFLQDHTEPKSAPLCGNSIWQDRRFLARHFPDVENHCHYRVVDVSSIKELVRRWYGEDRIYPKPEAGSHRALVDIERSIDELRFYRKNFFPESR